MVANRRAYRAIFPSLFGIRFAGRIKEDVYRGMIAKVNEAGDLGLDVLRRWFPNILISLRRISGKSTRTSYDSNFVF